MPTKYPVGGAAAVAQVLSHTVGGTPANGQTYDVLIGTKRVRYTATGVDTNATIATALLALLNADSAPPEHQELTWTNPSSAVLNSTADEPGRPSTITTAASGTGTFVTATVTANSGPEVWDQAENWNGGTIPVNGDTIDMSGYTGDFKYNLEGLSGVALGAFKKPKDSTGWLGLAEINEDNAALPYGEYRPRFCKYNVPPTLTEIGQGEGQGSPLVKVDLGQTANGTTSTVNVYGSAQPAIQDGRAIAIKMTHTGTGANDVAISSGSVGLAMFPGETMTFGTNGTLRIGYQNSQESDADVYLGVGVTIPSELKQTGGVVRVNSNMATLTHLGGTTYVYGSATCSTLCNIQKGTVDWRSNGTIAALNIGTEGVFNADADPRPFTVTVADVIHGAKIFDRQGRVTWVIDLNNIDVVLGNEVECWLGPNRRVTIGSVA